MNNSKKYRVSYDDKFEMIVEIDHAIMTDEELHEINNFWGDASYRFDKSNRNITETVLKLLASKAFSESIRSWDPVKAIEESEGWPTKMDGTFGIKIISIDDVVFDSEDIFVTVE
nr:DUF2528 family protein [uncultured Undibacterium sp.]